MNEQLISIILPIHNGQDFIEQALLSIEKQSYTNFEVIIINDASTDDTKKIVEKFCKRDSRFKLHNNKLNLKLPKSLNKGHLLAKGKFLTWTSHDNILKPNFLEVLLSYILNYKSDLVYSNYDIIFSNGNLKRKHITRKPAYLPFGNIVGASFLYTKELYYTLDGYDEDLFLVEDYDFWLRALRKFNLLHVEENLYKYRLHESSLTSNISKNKEYNYVHKMAINRMFHDLFSETESWSKYSEVLFKSYYGELEIHHLNDLVSLRKVGNKIFNIQNSEWNLVVNEKIRDFLIKSKIKRANLARFLLSNYVLLSYKYNKGKSLKLLKKMLV